MKFESAHLTLYYFLEVVDIMIFCIYAYLSFDNRNTVTVVSLTKTNDQKRKQINNKIKIFDLIMVSLTKRNDKNENK